MEESLKFQSSTFDTITRRKPIEDQSTILELSGRVQELQNEVNCMNVSKDFQDAESVRSGNSHVTSRPVSFSLHPIPEGMLRPFVSPRRREGPPCICDTHGISGNVFATPDVRLYQHLILKNCVNGIRQSKSRFIHPQWRKVPGPEQKQDLRCQFWTVSQRFSHLQWRRLFKELWEKTNNN